MRIRDVPGSWAPWPATEFPAHLGLAGARLRARVLERLSDGGTMREPCRSRVLETALALRLFERAGRPDRARLESFLRGRKESVDALDGLLAGLALGDRVRRHDLFDRLLAQVPEFTAARKRLLIDTILVLFDATPPAEIDPGTFNTTGLHSWAAVQVTALKVILYEAAGQRDRIRAGDIALLLSVQQQPWVWESNLLIHLSVLHALLPLPGMAGTVERGIGNLLEHQRPDGGLPFVSDTDGWCTATAGVALSAFGADPDVLEAIADQLVCRQLPNGGWSYTDRALQSDVDDTSVAVELLHTVNPVKYGPTIEQGLRSLLGVRGGDGGFPTYVAGAPSEACMTAAALNALSIQPTRYRDQIETGLRFLTARQHPHGGFDPDWSSSRLHTMFRAVLASAPVRANRLCIAALRAVRGSQNADGGWGQQVGASSDALSTSYALIALSQQTDPRPAQRGVDFLLAAQGEDGSIRTVSDSIGPRPFIFTVPLLADIFALLALGHVVHRLDTRLSGSRQPEQAVTGLLRGRDSAISSQ